MFNKIGVRIAILVNLVLLLVMLAGGGYLIVQQSNQLEAQLLERGQVESIVGAKIVGKVLDEAIDNGALKVADVFDQNYQLIPGFDPPKYRTRYDVYLDKAILSLQDEFLKDDSVVFAVAVDTKGYLPTHNTPFNQPPTGNVDVDRVKNRTKRIFNDPVGLRAATNMQPGLKQVYQRDTGETMWDVSSPIFVKGKHWGGFRIGFSLVKVNQAKRNLQLKVAAVMGVTLLLSCLLLYLTITVAMRPLKHLAQVASDLADGKIGERIVSRRKDEIGQLADVMERLRLSLKAAIDRLQGKR